MQEIFLPEYCSLSTEDWPFKWLIDRKSIDYPHRYKNVSIETLKRQSRTISDNQQGRKSRSTLDSQVRFRPEWKKEMCTYLSPLNEWDAWHPPRNPQNRKPFSFSDTDSYSDWIPALRMWSRNHFSSIRVLLCEGRENPSNFLRHFI